MADGVRVRPEGAADIATIRALNEAAFATSTEADLIEALRGHAEPIISLVADDAGTIVGHVLFSPVTLLGHEELKLMGLAPMSVLPTYQRGGIGSALVGAGLQRCAELGCDVVVVLGHPESLSPFQLRAGVVLRPKLRVRRAR